MQGGFGFNNEKHGLRTVFSSVHLSSARYYARQCKVVEDAYVAPQVVPDEIMVAYRADAISALFPSVSAMDAGILELFVLVKEGTGEIQSLDEVSRRCLLAMVAQATRKSGVSDKIDLVEPLIQNPGASFTTLKGGATWSHMQGLVKLRNLFTHPSLGTVWLDQAGDELEGNFEMI